MVRFIFLVTLLFSSIIYVGQAAANDDSTPRSANEYLLGAGDMVRVTVYGSQDLNTEARVSQEGTISFPLLGELKLTGLTPVQAEKLISKKLENGDFVKSPHVNLVVMQYMSQFVSVLGDVYKPGRFPLDRPTTLSDALALAGGVNQVGSDIVTLTRKNGEGTTKYTFDIRELLASGRTTHNPKIYDGDIVYVPKAPMFYIYGEVQRPGSFKLERDMTVAQALSTGGGLTARGTERGIKIKRIGADGNLKTIDASLGDKLQKDDVVVISESWF